MDGWVGGWVRPTFQPEEGDGVLDFEAHHECLEEIGSFLDGPYVSCVFTRLQFHAAVLCCR